jgi:hypothetical protein
MPIYNSRYVCDMSPGDEATTDGAAQILRRHANAVAVDGAGGCLAGSTNDSLLTLVGHGEANPNSDSIFAKLPGLQGEVEGWEVADFLMDVCGLRNVKMITVISCHGAVNGFAKELHESLASRKEGPHIYTMVNARTGLTTIQGGIQLVADKEIIKKTPETWFYRQKKGTKILFYWDSASVDVRVPRSSIVTEGYETDGLYRLSEKGGYESLVKDIEKSEMRARRISEEGPSPASAAAELEVPQVRNNFTSVKPKKKVSE